MTYDWTEIPWPQPDTVKLAVASPWLTDLEARSVDAALRDTWVGPAGPHLSQVETDLSQLFQAHASVVSNGTVALELALRGLRVGPGDEVIVPALTYAATASAVVSVGATPVFADCRADSWGLDASSVRRMITPRTRAMIIVHLYGVTTPMADLMTLAAESSIHVIEDCAETLIGSSTEGAAGSFGRVATYSFFANKLITCGEGGAVSTRDTELHDRMCLLRGQGMDPKKRYFFTEVGHNFRMPNLSAALLLAQIERLEEITSQRRMVEETYSAALSDIFERPSLPGTFVRSPWLYTARWKGASPQAKWGLAEYLSLSGVETRPVFFPLPLMPAFRSYRSDDIATSIAIAKEGISLPTGHHVSGRDQEELVNLIRHYHDWGN